MHSFFINANIPRVGPLFNSPVFWIFFFMLATFSPVTVKIGVPLEWSSSWRSRAYLNSFDRNFINNLNDKITKYWYHTLALFNLQGNIAFSEEFNYHTLLNFKHFALSSKMFMKISCPCIAKRNKQKNVNNFGKGTNSEYVTIAASIIFELEKSKEITFQPPTVKC